MDNSQVVGLFVVLMACCYAAYLTGYSIGRIKGFEVAKCIFEKSALLRGAIWKREFIRLYEQIHRTTPSVYLTSEESEALEELRNPNFKGD
jgi:hypothetical protein